MADIVTPGNEGLFRKQFSVTSGHSMECIEETAILMAKVLAGVCTSCELPPEALHDILEKMDIEIFEKHLSAILDCKDCDCNQTN